MKCMDHPKYHGKGKPRSHCLDCWKIYGKVHKVDPEGKIELNKDKQFVLPSIKDKYGTT